MLDLFIVIQFYYVNKLDTISEKTYQAAYIQSGLNSKVNDRKKFYKDEIDYKVDWYKKEYLNERIEKNLGKIIFISDLLINKKVGVTYEF